MSRTILTNEAVAAPVVSGVGGIEPANPICLVLQYDDRSDVPYPRLRQWNREYAQRHGFDYELMKFSSQPLPCYWGKVQAIRDMLPLYDYILVSLADCVYRSLLSKSGHPRPAPFSPSEGDPWLYIPCTSMPLAYQPAGPFQNRFLLCE
jgi:hypothetical protein